MRSEKLLWELGHTITSARHRKPPTQSGGESYDTICVKRTYLKHRCSQAALCSVLALALLAS